jgi:hypothetical protein
LKITKLLLVFLASLGAWASWAQQPPASNVGFGVARAEDRPEMAFLFVTRQLVEQKKFDDQIDRRVDVNANLSATVNSNGSRVTNRSKTLQDDSLEDSVVTTSDAKVGVNSSVATTVSSSSAGSVTSKRARRLYRISSSESFNSAFLEGFTSKDLPLDPIELETEKNVNLEAVKEDFAIFEEIQAPNLQKLLAEAKSAGFKYISIGTLDVSIPAKDEYLGVLRVGVRVNAKVYDLSGRRTRTMLALQPILVNGFDSDEIRAQSKAVREAASRASKEFLTQLSSKSLAY